MNAQEIERSLRLLHDTGATFEIRALGNERGYPVTLSGYFTDAAVAAAAVVRSCGGMTGVYTTLNPVRPELAARCMNRIARAGKSGTTADPHVLRRTRLLIDIDGVPVAGISATADEHAAALALAAEIESDLTALGWPRPLRGDSGNGAHLDYAIDIPADDDGLVARVLQAAHAHYGRAVGDVTLKIDTSNKNPARITKVFGTPARKGEDLPERPHRMSRIVAAPDVLVTVPRDLLEKLASSAPAPQRPAAPGAALGASRAAPRGTLAAYDVPAFIARYGIDLRGTKPWDGGTLYELAICPMNADHNRGEAHIAQHASGAVSAGCFHESCHLDWDWLREHFEGPRPVAGQRPLAGAAPASAAPTAPPDELAARRARQHTQLALPGAGHAGIGPGGGYRLTDLGNARRFADQQHDGLRYVQAWGQWLSWDGARWRRDSLGAAQEAAKRVVASVYAEAARLATRAAAAIGVGETVVAVPVDEIAKHARDSAKRGRIDAMVGLARSEPELARDHGCWDVDPWLLNVRNGTIDLRTGELAPHAQTDMLTMIARVEYDIGALAPRFEAFLERMQPDVDVRMWLQRYLGYALTGDVREQCLAFFYGGGSNGKSVLLDVVLALLGDYGLRAAPDLVLAKHGEAHPTELADLEGKRLVVCSEIEQGRMWAESTIKRITGDNTISARRMRQDFYTFPATHKLVVAANTRPTVRGTDHGIWRRMRLMPWAVTVADHEQDRTLAEQLIATEGPGILAWLVRGCLGWQRLGLPVPAAITAATADYRAGQDVIGRWIDDRCELIGWQATASLYADFVEWCKDEGITAWSRRIWIDRLAERDGITTAKMERSTVRAVVGISLRGVR